MCVRIRSRHEVQLLSTQNSVIISGLAVELWWRDDVISTNQLDGTFVVCSVATHNKAPQVSEAWNNNHWYISQMPWLSAAPGLGQVAVLDSLSSWV